MTGLPISPEGAVKTLGDLWDRAPAFLWTLAACALLTFGIAIVAELYSGVFPSTGFWITLGVFAVLLALAAGRSINGICEKSLHIVVNDTQCFVGVTQQKDGSYTTQIQASLDIYNRTRGPVTVATVSLRSPRSRGVVFDHRIWNVEYAASIVPASEQNELEPGRGGRFRMIIMMADDLEKKKGWRGISLNVYDHRGLRHPIYLRHYQFHRS